MLRNLLLIFSLALGLHSVAQNCSCAIEKKMEAAFRRNYGNRNDDSCKIICNKMIASNSAMCRAKGHFWNAALQNGNGKNELAREELNVFYKILSTDCPSSSKSDYFILSASLYFEDNQLDHAAVEFKQAAMEAEKHGETENKGIALNSLATIFNRLNQTEKAISYRKESIALLRKVKDVDLRNEREAGALNNLAVDYCRLFEETNNKKYLDSALAAQKKGLEKIRPYERMQLISQNYNIAARVYLNGQDYRMAHTYADSALLTGKKSKDYQSVSSAYRKKCSAYMKTGDLRLAKNAADSSYAYALLDKQTTELIDALEKLYESSRALGDFEDALLAYEQMNVLNDSIMDIQKFETILELERKYDKSRTERIIQDMQHTKKVDDLQITLLVGGVFLLGLIIILVIFFYRQLGMRSQQRIMEAEQKALRAQMNPHFLFNSLNGIQNLVVKEDFDGAYKYLGKFSSLMRNILNNSRETSITIAREIEFLNLYLEIESMRFRDGFTFEIKRDPLVNQSVRIPSMVIQPFVENAIIHGLMPKQGKDDSAHLLVEFTSNAQGLTCVIEDDGVGRQVTADGLIQKTKDSLGMEMVRERIQLFDKSGKSNYIIHDLKSKDGKNIGTRITIFFKY